jgi:hypothetical protein
MTYSSLYGVLASTSWYAIWEPRLLQPAQSIHEALDALSLECGAINMGRPEAVPTSCHTKRMKYHVVLTLDQCFRASTMGMN